MFKPNGWENPYLAYPNPQPYDKAQIFEAGADAMLQALESQKHQDWLATPKGESCSGRWVFIPDE